MVTSSRTTLAEILAGIAALKARLTVDLQRVKDYFPSPTPAQQNLIQQVQTQHDKLQSDLDNASAAVSISTTPADEWNSWIGSTGTISDELNSMDQLLNTTLGDTLGVCTYKTGTACMTQAQCLTLPGGSWTSGGCTTI